MFDFDDDVLDALPPASPWAGEDPVVCCWYSGGFTHDDGEQLYKDFLMAASLAGIEDIMVFGFPDHYGFCGEGYEDWPKYVDHLVDEIDSVEEYRTRPLLLIGHSRGGCPAMSMATKLGDRVLKVYIVACPSIPLGEPTPWEKQTIGLKDKNEKDLLMWFSSLQPDNILLKSMGDLPVEDFPAAVEGSPWLKKTVKLMLTQYKYATFPDMCCHDPPIKMIVAPIIGCSGRSDSLFAHSTPEKEMAGFAECTTGGYEYWEFEADHLGILSCQPFIDKVIQDILPYFPTNVGGKWA